jgi:hypothetical protein
MKRKNKKKKLPWQKKWNRADAREKAFAAEARKI